MSKNADRLMAREDLENATGTGHLRFRPGLWATLCTLLALAVLLGLGTWQVQRLSWKEAMIAERQARSAAAPMALPGEIADPQALEFRPIRVTGRFLHDRELYLANRTYKRVVGLHVVTPMVLNDGRSLLVDRGWAPMDRRDPATRAAGQTGGSVTLEGLLRSGGWKGSALFRPDNEPGKNVWLWFDLPAMAAAAGLEAPVTALYLEAGPAENPGGLPRGGRTPINLRNDHLQYAITWYALAAVLLVIYVIFHTRREDGG
jgi:surfeit locus 1 family protein